MAADEAEMNLFNSINKKDHWLRQGLLFRKVIYVYLIFFCLQMLLEYDWLLGVDSVYFVMPPAGYGLNTFLNLLSHQKFAGLSWVFILGLISSSIIGLLGWYPRVISILIWFFTVNLNNRILLTGTGGEALLNNLLFLQLFFSDGKHPKNATLQKLSFVIDNVSVIACRIQVIFVYLLSATFKILDQNWISGEALSVVFSIPDFATLWARQLFCRQVLILKILTWSSLLYQIMFPILVWIKPVKKYLLILGIILHLGIAFTLGLYNFSAVMIIAYLLFI